MHLSELSLKMIKTMKILRITTFIVLACMIAMFVSLILSLSEIFAFDIALAITSIFLLVSSIVIFKEKNNLKKLQEIIDCGEFKILFGSDHRTVVSLQESYIYKSFDEQNNCYVVDKKTFIPSLFVKEDINNKIVLFDVGTFEQGAKVNLVDFSIFGDCVVEVNEEKYLFSNSDIFIELI